MKLAIVSLMGGLQWGGSEALWYTLANHALDRNDEVLISIYDWGFLHEKVKYLQSRGAIVHTRIRFNANAKFTERIIRFVKVRRPSFDKAYRTIIDFKPDAVFISQGDSFDIAIHHRPFYQLLKKQNVSYSFVCHSHVQYSFIPPKEIFPDAVNIFRDAKKVYFVSNRQWKITERRLAMKILNGAFTWNPLNLILPQSPLKWPSGKEINFALVGNVTGTKGHDTAFEVLSSNEWRERNWRLNIYGMGDGLLYLQSLAAFYGLTDKVNFMGHVKDILTVWKTNNLLLIPSASEGLPISLVEAMACGRPAVVTDVGGNSELIDEGENGFIAASPTSEAFSAALEKAWNKNESWKQLGLNAFQKIESVYDTNAAKKIYQQILGDNENNF